MITNTFFFVACLTWKNKTIDWADLLIKAALLFAAARGFGIKSWLSGNISLTLYFLALTPPVVFKNRIFEDKILSLSYAGLVLMAASFKPYFLIYLILFLQRRNKFNLAVFILSPIIFIFLMKVPFQDIYLADWYNSLKIYSSNFTGDMGKNPLISLARSLNLMGLVSWAAMVNSVIIVSFLAWATKKNFFNKENSPVVKIETILLLCVLSNPRIKMYDLFVIPFLMYEHLNIKNSWKTWVLLILPFYTPLQLWAIYESAKSVLTGQRKKIISQHTSDCGQ